MKQKLTALLVCLLTALLCILSVGAEELQTEEEKQAFYQQEQAKWDEACRQEDERYHQPVNMAAAQRDMEEVKKAAGDSFDTAYIIPNCRMFSKISTDLTFDQIYSNAGNYVLFRLDGDGNRVGQAYFNRRVEGKAPGWTSENYWFDEALSDLIDRYPDKKSVLLIDRLSRYLMVQMEEGTELIYPLPLPDEYKGEYKANANSRSSQPLDADWQTFLNAAVYRNENDPVVSFTGELGGGGKITDYLGKKPASNVNWTAVLFIGGGCAVVLAAAGGILLTVRRRKKSRGTF